MLNLRSEVCKFCKIFEIEGWQEHMNLCRFFYDSTWTQPKHLWFVFLPFCVYFLKDCKGSFLILYTFYIIMFTGSLRGNNSCQLVAPSSPKSNKGNLLCLARLSSHTEIGVLLFDCVAPLALFICSFYPPFPVGKTFSAFFTTWFSFSQLS